MSDSSIKETDWIVGTIDGRVVHHAPQKSACLTWLAQKHKLGNPPRSHRLEDGVYDVTIKTTVYWVMNGAPTARANGYDIPLPEIPATYGLTNGQAALIETTDGPVFMWARGDDILRQPAPDDVTDLDAWAAKCAARLRSYRITYLGRRAA